VYHGVVTTPAFQMGLEAPCTDVGDAGSLALLNVPELNVPAGHSSGALPSAACGRSFTDSTSRLMEWATATRGKSP